MASVMRVITNTVPITQFHRGLAGKIFDEVNQCGAKIVMKNSAAECVLIVIGVRADEKNVRNSPGKSRHALPD